MPYSGYKLFRNFYLFPAAAIIVVLFVTGLGLRHVLRNLTVLEAEDDAIRVSTAARDCEIRRYIGQDYNKNERFLTFPPEELPEVDRHIRVFIGPFDIIKIRIFNTEPRVIYSTDPEATGKLDPNNISLLTALAGTPISKYERADEVWHLDDEERTSMEILETYVPMYGTDGKIIGSLELRKDITRNLAMADKIFVRSWGALAVTVLGVFATLIFVIHRAVQTVKVSTVNLMTTNEQLQQGIEDRRRLEKELLSINQRERQRIGQELHDTVGQQLAGIQFMMEVLGEKLSDKSLSEQVSYAEKINARVSQVAEQTHNLARGLYPIDLDRNGLVPALYELTVNTEQLFDVSCTLECEKNVSTNDFSAAINLYRIAQEAITNAIKHGKAKSIKIELTSKDDSLILTVENDGLDFQAGPSHGEGMGLKIMRYRAEIINGSLDIRKGTKGGTIVTCVLPNEENP